MRARRTALSGVVFAAALLMIGVSGSTAGARVPGAAKEAVAKAGAPVARSAASTPPAGVRARYQRCPAHYRLVYRGGRIGCYRRGKPLRKARCAVGYHHPGGAFSCVPDPASIQPPAPTSGPPTGPPAPGPTPPKPTPTPPTPGQPVPLTPPLNTTNPTAGSTQYWSTGLYGRNVMGSLGSCTYLNAWDQLRLEGDTPLVYAHDDHVGVLDTATVRYRTFLVNYQTGETLLANAYSDAVVATEYVAATFPATQSFQYRPYLDHPGDLSTVLDVRIEWWSGSVMTGAVAHRVPRYNYYVGGAGPGGVLDSCAVILFKP